MNPVKQILAPRAFALIFAASVTGLAGCSKGTDPGDTNVEYSDPKDRDPTEHNREGGSRQTMEVADTHQDTINALMDTSKLKNDPYERARNPETSKGNDPHRR